MVGGGASKSCACDSNSSRAGGIGVDASTTVDRIGNFLRTSSCASFGGTASRSARHVEALAASALSSLYESTSRRRSVASLVTFLAARAIREK